MKRITASLLLFSLLTLTVSGSFADVTPRAASEITYSQTPVKAARYEVYAAPPDEANVELVLGILSVAAASFWWGWEQAKAWHGAPVEDTGAVLAGAPDRLFDLPTN